MEGGGEEGGHDKRREHENSRKHVVKTDNQDA